jgi:hypothetical protein
VPQDLFGDINKAQGSLSNAANGSPLRRKHDGTTHLMLRPNISHPCRRGALDGSLVEECDHGYHP